MIVLKKEIIDHTWKMEYIICLIHEKVLKCMYLVVLELLLLHDTSGLSSMNLYLQLFKTYDGRNMRTWEFIFIFSRGSDWKQIILHIWCIYLIAQKVIINNSFTKIQNGIVGIKTTLINRNYTLQCEWFENNGTTFNIIFHLTKLLEFKYKPTGFKTGESTACNTLCSDNMS